MKTLGFSLLEVLLALILLSGFMLVSFEVLQNLEQLEHGVQQKYMAMKLKPAS